VERRPTAIELQYDSHSESQRTLQRENIKSDTQACVDSASSHKKSQDVALQRNKALQDQLQALNKQVAEEQALKF
jgi:hypothetical protein